jgi:hypothetical protein
MAFLVCSPDGVIGRGKHSDASCFYSLSCVLISDATPYVDSLALGMVRTCSVQTGATRNYP